MKLIKDILNGMDFGVTLLIPGVSSGSVAIVLGFYDELIKAVSEVTENIRKHLKFLMLLLFGAAVGVLVFSSLISWLLSRFSLPAMFFFIGLIMGIIPHIYIKVKEPHRPFNLRETLLVVVPILLLVVISHIKNVPITDPAQIIANIGVPYMVFLFTAGLLAAAALIIPGLSGSFVLLIMGVYPVVTHSIQLVLYWIADMGNIQLVFSILKVLAPFGVGVILGGLFTARLIGRLLKNHHKTVYLSILGLFIGSVYALFREPMVYHSGVSALIIIAGVVTFMLGFAASFALGKKRL